MKIGNIELTHERFIVSIISIALLAIMLIYLIFYAPVISRLRVSYIKCKTTENEVLECRHIIESAGKVYGERVLMTEKDISQAIDELTRHGKLKSINIVSMTPKTIEEKDQYKILPIEMEVESTYNQLGTFLGSLDDLKKGLVKIKSFVISSDEKNPSRLTAKMIADMYLSGRENVE